jgi:hypothetical protein
MAASGQKRRFERRPITSGLRRLTDMGGHETRPASQSECHRRKRSARKIRHRKPQPERGRDVRFGFNRVILTVGWLPTTALERVPTR